MGQAELTPKDEAWFKEPEKRKADKITGRAVDAAVERGVAMHQAEQSLDDAFARGIADTDAEIAKEETREKAA